MLKQRTLLKSIISFQHDAKEMEYLVNNFNIISTSNIIFSLDLHDKLYQYVCDHIRKYTEVPSFDRIKKQFEEESDVLEELSKISQEPTLYSNNFKSLVSDVFIEQQKKDLVNLFKEAMKISEEGKRINKEVIIGPKKAMEFILGKSLNFLKTENKIKLEGSLKGQSHEAYADYIESKKNNKFDGLLTGLPTIDLACKGVNSGEFWLIAAYVSELKTTLAMNLAYTQVVEQGKNIKFISLEMPYQKVRDLFIVLHSANLNLWPGSEWDDVYPLSYNSVAECTLTEREESFYEFLCNDLDNNAEYGYLDIYQPPDGMTMPHLRTWSEIEYRKRPFHAVYLDYLELMKKVGGYGDYGTDLNQLIKEAKQYTLHFNDGLGMRLISAYQMNRKGKEQADKNNGEYRLDALSYANEAERSADVILSSYLNDELRDNNQVKIACLKNRWKAKFKLFNAKTNLASRKIYETPEMSPVASSTDSLSKNKKKKIKQEDLINDLI